MPERPTEEVARAAGEAVREHTRLRRFVGRRLDPSVATGLLLTVALCVGLVTGVVGIGGGFLIVPALVLLGRISMKQAVGTSLLVIAMNCARG